MKFYKLTDKDGHGTYGVDFVPVTYEMGKTRKVLDCTPSDEVCGKGLHVCDSPLKLLKFRNRTNLLDLRLWEVEVDEANIIAKDKNKTRVSKLTVTKELDIAQLFEHNGKEVIEFIKSLPTCPWLKPNKNLDEGILEQLVYEHLTELSAYGNKSFEGVGVRIVRTKEEWNAAYYASYDAAWNAAQNAAWNAAQNAARNAACNAA